MSYLHAEKLVGRDGLEALAKEIFREKASANDGLGSPRRTAFQAAQAKDVAKEEAARKIVEEALHEGRARWGYTIATHLPDGAVHRQPAGNAEAGRDKVEELLRAGQKAWLEQSLEVL